MPKIASSIAKLALKAGKATPAPPVGPVLSQYGINISAFCKEYNDQTKDQIGTIIPVEIFVYEDKSYSFILKTPPASILLLQTINKKKGASEPNHFCIGQITHDELKKIAKIKLPDFNTKDIGCAIKIIEGTAKNMGIKIIRP